MKRPMQVLFVILILAGSSLLDACSFSFEIISTPGPTTPTATSRPSTPTMIRPTPTAVLPSVTPTQISINADTILMIEIFKTLGPQEIVRSLAFTPDRTVLAAAGGDTDDFNIHLWDVVKGQPISTLNGHSGIVWGIAFSPDGQLLASASSDGTVKIWDWRSGNILKTLSFPDQVGSVSFSPDGQTLAVGGLDNSKNLKAAIWTFSTATWESLLKIPESVNITAMTYAPNGRLLIGGGASRNVQVWRTSDGTSIFTLNHAQQVLDATVSPDSSTAATGTCASILNEQCTEGSVWIWNLSTGKLVNRLGEFPDVVESVVFSTDGSLLIAASRDGMLRVYDTTTYDLAFLADPPGGNGALAISPDGTLLATGSGNGNVHLWKIVYRP